MMSSVCCPQIETLCGIGWAVTAFSTPWSTAFGTVAGPCHLVNNADEDAAINNRAHGVVYVRIVKDHLSNGTYTDVDATGPYEHFTTGPHSPASVTGTVSDGDIWVVGDCYTSFIELESACSAMTRLLLTAEVECQVGLECLGNQELTAEQDYSTYFLQLRCQ